MLLSSCDDEEADDVLEDDLQLARVLDAQLRADGQAEHEDDQADERGEDEVIGRVDAERRQQRVDQLDDR